MKILLLGSTGRTGKHILKEAEKRGYSISAIARDPDKLNGLNAEIILQGRNLGDQKYVAFTEPDPGGNAYQPGAGREFFGTVRIGL